MATIALSLVTAVLVIAVVALYGEVQQLRADLSPLPAWPLGTVLGGELNPVGDLALPGTGFIVLAPIPRNAYPSVLAAAYVATRWDHPLVVVTLAVDPPSADLRDAVRDASARHVHASPRFFDAVSLQASPTVVFLRDGKVQDALARPSSPAEVAEHFVTVAGPLGRPDPLHVAQEALA